MELCGGSRAIEPHGGRISIDDPPVLMHQDRVRVQFDQAPVPLFARLQGLSVLTGHLGDGRRGLGTLLRHHRSLLFPLERLGGDGGRDQRLV